jgi:hypothetical protein
MTVFIQRETALKLIAQATEKFNGKFNYRFVNFVNKKTPVIIDCPVHGIFNQRLQTHAMSAHGCSKCASESGRMSQEEVIHRFNEAHDNIKNPKFDYSKVEYKGMTEKVEIVCLVHGSFWQLPSDHIRQHGCGKCKGDQCRERRTVSLEDMLAKFEEIHEGKYTYPEIESYYVDGSTSIKIKCETHGIFVKEAHSHLYYGCPKCGKASAADKLRGREKPNQRTTTEEYIAKANAKHDFRYEYDKTVYVKSKDTTIIVTCKKHGDFEISPKSHLTGWGCKTCSRLEMGERFSLKVPELVEKLNLIHDFKYDYSKVELCGDIKNIPITVICPDHGEFSILVGKHYKYGCPVCEKENPKIKNNCVKGSKPANAWLDSLGLDLVREFRLPEKRIRPVDGYCIETNTIYQFHGDYFHGNPRKYDPSSFSTRHDMTFGELYEHSCRMDQEIIDFGYNLVVMWENDWTAIVKEEKRIAKEAKKLEKKLNKKPRKK